MLNNNEQEKIKQLRKLVHDVNNAIMIASGNLELLAIALENQNSSLVYINTALEALACGATLNKELLGLLSSDPMAVEFHANSTIKKHVNTKQTILLVDDDEDICKLITSYLKQLGYHLLLAHEGQSAIDIIKNHPDIKLLITDLIMPGPLTGIEVANTAKEINKSIKILLTSGMDIQNKDFPYPVMIKPFNLTLLAETIKRLLFDK